MIPDNVFIRCHSFWRNDLLKPHFKAFLGVILLGAMRAFWNCAIFACAKRETCQRPVETA
jgi:hypothetical protein